MAGPKRWGSLGRRGAGRLAENRVDARNAAGAQARDDRPDPGHEKVEWKRVDAADVKREAAGAVERGRRPASAKQAGGGARPGAASADAGGRTGGRGGKGSQRGAEHGLEPKEKRGRQPRAPGSGSGGAQARDELVRALGAQRGAKANERLRDAAHAFERERYAESRTLLKPIAEAAPQAAAVRELLGLTYYRLGRWSDALRELTAFVDLTQSTEQHPVVADCNRALKRHQQVEAVWDELREASPAPDLVVEGRIVMAGSLADRDRVAEAVALLEKSHRGVKRPQVHHLRQAYVLADLYERAGDVTRSRELFRWIVSHQADFADAGERAVALS